MPNFDVASVASAAGERPASKRASARKWTFARHETFHLRDGWLYKALRALESDPLALYRPDAHQELGVGPNMLRSILYWVRATGIVEPENQQKVQPPLGFTPLGSLIFEFDPYLEDTATLWLLHTELASNRSLATFWYWAFNEFDRSDFGADQLVDGIGRFLRDQEAEHIVESSLRKDATCFLRTYTPAWSKRHRESFEDSLDCPLAELGLVQRQGGGRFRFASGAHPSLPAAVFGYALRRYRDIEGPDRIVFSLEELRWRPLSPGRLLGLDSEAILAQLESLEREGGGIRISRTAGLSTVTMDERRDAISIIASYYQAGRHA